VIGLRMIEFLFRASTWGPKLIRTDDPAVSCQWWHPSEVYPAEYQDWSYKGISRSPKMKIATFNTNEVNKRLENLVARLSRAVPDIGCLQELKAEQHEFS